MKKLIIALAALSTVALSVPAEAKYIKGYHRHDGTYVHGHHRHAPKHHPHFHRHHH